MLITWLREAAPGVRGPAGQALAAITRAPHAHPEAEIFTSLPRSGRSHSPTRQSGHTRVVAFRWAVDKQLRDNPWAAHRYQQARDRGKT